ncbi:PKD-like family lipoprotein [Leeuwenhoekiella marinoflava]|uniref:PKD family protein n=2 Tax=Leeuwenhoekiella marinoflava TaxID=988 RepID=A0A4Q0PMU9_9FLAO|nr:PKD-like family lipoprotein [Leeuwenhoekiella marinoflava]RXG31849.1 PKD family protein [Leeuwenhoekiella marinoflava]SHF02790.1 PKD-like family protein [Leeuwenhoekiella marinoflava DSM 3653]
MKRITILFLFTIFTVLYYSCVEDNDNVYDNSNFNSVNVIVDTTEVPSSVLQFDTLYINPVISQSQQTDESNLTYEWTVRTDEQFINAPIDTVVTTISTDRNLAYEVTLTTGDKKFALRVTDENTGVTSVGYFYVNVQNQFSEGWLVLEEKDGQGDLSIILPDGATFRDIYSSINPEAPLEIPLRQLVVTNFSYGVDEITILSENSGIQLDYSELLKLFNLEDLFWNLPSVLDPEYHVWHGASNGWIINGGQIHLQVRGGFPGDKKYGSAMAFPNGVGNDYYAAPFVAQGTSPYPAVVYDNQGQYFTYLADGLSPLLKNFPPAPAGAPFDMNNVGLEMVYMETGNEQYLINAVLKAESEEYYMLQFRANLSEPAQTYKMMTSATDISSNTVFKNSKTLDRMYYSVGNQIYLYDIPSGLIVGSPFSLPNGETITHLEINATAPSVLMVATWNGDEGHVYKLNMAGTGALSLIESFSGFGEIIDMDYKD